MTEKEIIFSVIKELNGVKHLSKQQVSDFIEHIFYRLPIEENYENNKIIIDAIETYFKLQNI